MSEETKEEFIGRILDEFRTQALFVYEVINNCEEYFGEKIHTVFKSIREKETFEHKLKELFNK